MHLLRSGNDVNMVSYWLGHVDINTTHIYLEIDMEMKRKMIEKADAPAIKIKAAWHKPDVLQWLNALGKAPELCAVNWQKMKNNSWATISRATPASSHKTCPAPARSSAQTISMAWPK